MWRGPNLTELKELCLDGETTIEDVLNHNALHEALRYDQKEVIDMLAEPDSVAAMLRMIVMNKVDTDPECLRMSRLAIDVLTSPCVDIQMQLMDSDDFSLYMCGFFDRKNTAESRLRCGYYCRLLNGAINFTSGSVLSVFPDLISTLCDHLHILAVRSFIGRLLTDTAERGVEIEPVFEAIASAIEAGMENAYPGTMIIREMVRVNVKRIAEWDMTKIVSAMLSFCVNEATSVFHKIEGYVTLRLVLDVFKEHSFDKVLNEFESRVDFEAEGVLGDVAYRVYRSKFMLAFDKFMEQPRNGFLGEAVLRALQEMDVNQIATEDIENLVDKVIAKFSEDEKCAGHLTEIARLINRVPAVSENEKWKVFAENVLNKYVSFIEAVEDYGWEQPGYNAGHAHHRVKRERVDLIVRCSSSHFDFDSDDEYMGDVWPVDPGQPEEIEEEEEKKHDEEEETEAERQSNEAMRMMLGYS